MDAIRTCGAADCLRLHGDRVRSSQSETLRATLLDNKRLAAAKCMMIAWGQVGRKPLSLAKAGFVALGAFAAVAVPRPGQEAVHTGGTWSFRRTVPGVL